MSHRHVGHAVLAAAMLVTQTPLAWCGETPLVDTRKTSTSTTVNRDQINNLPANGRSFADLATLQPGIANNKTSPADSVNWGRQPMPEHAYQGITSLDPSALSQTEVLTSNYSAEYGRPSDGVLNTITKGASSEVQGFSRYYLEGLARSREWPGEAYGLNGMVAATGRARGKERVAVIYDFDGYPLEVYTANDLKKHPDDVMEDLHENCDLISSGKVGVDTGYFSGGKLTSGKLMSGTPRFDTLNREAAPRSTSGGTGPAYDLPKDYKLDFGLGYDLGHKYDGGGMVQIDAPAAPPGPGQTPQGTPTAPTESVLDDLGPGPTPPLHPDPEGEPTVKNNPDGSSVRTYPDGTTEHVSPDGGTFVRYADGASFQRFPDGTAVDRKPDGSTTTRDKDGKVTGQTAPTVVNLGPGGRGGQAVQEGLNQRLGPQGGSTSGTSTTNPNVVNDQTIRDATDKQQPAVRDAINQYLTPQSGSSGSSGSGQTVPPSSDSTPRSGLPKPRRWLQAFASWLVETVHAAGTGAARVSTTDADGNTVTIEKVPGAGTTRTITDPGGRVLERGPLTPEPVTTVPPRERGTSASTRDAAGNTTTIKKQPDGSTTRTVTSPDGRILEQGPVTQPEPTKVPPRQPGTTSASTTDAAGNTTTITKNPDGTTTRTVTDASGRVTESGPVAKPEPTKVPPRDHTTSASATDADGNTVTITKNPDGTMARTVTDASGRVTESGPVAPPPPTKVPPRRPGTTSASSTDADGNTTTISRNPDGSVTRTVTDASGTLTEQGPLTPPPVTKPAPRDLGAPFAGTTDAHGNTITLHKAPDGSTVQTVTDASGRVISHGPVTPPPVTKPQPRKPGTWASTTDANGNTLTVEKLPDGSTARTITDPDGTVIERTVNGQSVPAPATTPAATPTATTQPAAPAGNDHLSGLGLGYKPPYNLRLPLQYSFDTPAASIPKPDDQQPFVPFMESGVIIGDTVYSNLGTYKVGEHPILDRNKQTPLSQPRINPYAYGTMRYGVNPATGSRLRPVITLPQDFVPQMVGVLPHGCNHPMKTAFFNEIQDAINGTLPQNPQAYLWEAIFWMLVAGKPAPAESARVPNDPLYDKPGEVNTAKARRSAYDVGQAMNLPASAPREGTVAARKAKGPLANDQWGLQAVGFTPLSQPGSAWSLVDAERPNTLVAVIDSGLDLAHPDGPQYVWTNPGEAAGNKTDDDGNGLVDDVHGWNFHDNNADLTDLKGHGTLVAGIIAARRNNGIGIAGINPGARIMALKVTDAYGKANSLNLYRAIHYAVDHGARVLNVSLSGAGTSKLLQLAVNYAHSRGAVVIVAAGNDGDDVAKHAPGSLRRAVTVAALGMDRQPYKLSNYGTAIALTAPGEEIYSLQSKDAEWPGPSSARDRRYRPASGTSFAAPMVAATASLILAKHPQLPNVVVEDLLLDSVGDAWNPSHGWGVLNAAKALSVDPSRAVTIWPNEVVVNRSKNTVSSVDVFGTIRGVFTAYRVEVGKGRSPSAWQAVGAPISRPTTQGLLCRIPGEALQDSKEWTIRITAEGRGTTRVAQVPVTL